MDLALFSQYMQVMHKTFLGKVYNLVSNPPCEVEMEAAPPPLSAQFDEQEKKDSNRKTLK